MPEGPEVKTVARTLSQHLVGCTLGELWHSSLKLRRRPDYKALKRLQDARIEAVDSYGKVLFIYSDNKPVIMAQLGMTGQLKVEDCAKDLAPHTHIRWQIAGSKQELRYVDPRRFGLVDACDVDKKKDILERLGPDPFSITKAQRAVVIDSMRKSRRAIKEILLDQSVLVGVGNIYASESLFRAKIDPRRAGVDLSKKEGEILLDAVVDVLKLAYQNCGTTFSNYVDGSGKKGDNLAFLRVFMRWQEPCFVCATDIARIKQGGRSTFYCSNCQK